MAKSGYSGTPLAKKLGYKSGFKVLVVNEPEYYKKLLPSLPEDVHFSDRTHELMDMIHFFTKSIEEMHIELSELKQDIVQNGMIWVSWPKKASKVISDMSEDAIRNHALDIGLVDIKVCSINEVWSGLKLVIPVKDRIK